MILEAATAALARLPTPPFRAVFLKSIGLTLAALALAWVAIAGLFDAFAVPALSGFLPSLPDWAGWLAGAAAVLAGIALALGLGLLIAPATALIAGLFLDDVAEIVEREDWPDDPPGRPLPTMAAAIVSVKFLVLVVATT